LKKAAKSGLSGAAKALGLSENPAGFLSLVQFWLTLTGTIAGVLGGTELAQDLQNLFTGHGMGEFSARITAFGIVIICLSSFIFLFGELVPKRIAASYPEKTAARLASVVGALAWLASPLLFLFGAVSERIARMVGAKPRSAADTVGEDEVRALVEKGLHAGVFHRAEKEMVDRVLALDHLSAMSIMTPRPKIVFLNIDDAEETNWRKIVASGHSYFPVYQGSRDQVIGLVAVKALWANSAIGLPAQLRDLLVPHLAVPERMTAIALLEQFKKSGKHLAVVVDEYGAVKGLVSLIDVMEAIVGDIPDGSHKTQPAARQRKDGALLVDASLTSADLKTLLKLELELPREGDVEFQTLGGFVVSQFGRIPKEGEHFDWAGWRFEVIDMDRLRVDKVLITRLPQTDGMTPSTPPPQTES
jgi:putative hemolysin